MTPVALRGIRKTYGSTVVLDHIELAIESGELFFLLGPSGCGKSTLLRIIAGFLTPDSGSVAFGKDDVTTLAPEKRQAGMVFQSYALWPHMTVFQNVAFGLEVLKVPAAEREKRVMEALDMVGLEHLRERPIPQLSGGQQQRVALARAVVIRPRVLLLDEPLSNLDAKLRLEMRSEIRRICKETGLTTIYVTHDQKEALSMADRVALLNNGRLTQVAPPMEIYRKPCSTFVADFIGESNFVDGKVTAAAAGEVTVETAWGTLTASTASATLEAGSPCKVCVRPESFQFDPPADAPNRLEFTIADWAYLGEIGQWSLSLNGAALKAFELRPRPRQTGDTVSCAIAPTDVIVLPPGD